LVCKRPAALISERGAICQIKLAAAFSMKAPMNYQAFTLRPVRGQSNFGFLRLRPAPTPFNKEPQPAADCHAREAVETLKNDESGRLAGSPRVSICSI
jgi:hypothetical protein